MEGICDLHTHSVFSDGTCTPAELIGLAQEAGLAAVALTDHNTVGGLPEFCRAAQGSGVKAVPGIEFSTDYRGTELHILGLFLKEEHYETIMSRMDRMLEEKDRSNRDLVNALNMTGLRLGYDKIKTSTPNGQVNRAVIGAELVRLGYAESVKDAFARYLSVKCGYYQPPERPESLEIIRLIKSLGAAAVLAHPLLNLKREEALREFLKEAVLAGLDAMETMYPLFDKEQTQMLEALAAEFGLLSSGGSDFHGKNKPDIAIGIGKGSLRVSAEVLERLERRIFLEKIKEI